MLLALNLGNTNIAFALFQGTELLAAGRLSHADLPFLAERIGPRALRRILAASVAPALDDRVSAHLAAAYALPVEWAGRDLPHAIEIEYDVPQQLGADRALSALAAHHRVRGPVIIADVGTALTVDLVNRRGAFAGGTIAPGPALMARALHQSTQLLPEVTDLAPPPVPPRNTRDAIRGGIYWGTLGLVREIVARLRAHAGADVPLLVTGGGGEFLSRELPDHPPYLPHLTLEGLALLAARSPRR